MSGASPSSDASNNAVRVRAGQLDDTETIARFQERMALTTENRRLDAELVRNGIKNAMQDARRGRYLVAEIDQRIVGSLLVTQEWSDWRNGWFYWIQSVWVDEDYRRRGVYRALHEHVRQEAREAAEVCGVRLYVERDNERAQSTYRSLGMVETAYRLYEEELSSS